MDDLVCDNCKAKLNWGIYRYSLATFRKALCMTCQKEERVKTYPKKLAEMMNKSVDSYKNTIK